MIIEIAQVEVNAFVVFIINFRNIKPKQVTFAIKEFKITILT